MTRCSGSISGPDEETAFTLFPVTFKTSLVMKESGLLRRGGSDDDFGECKISCILKCRHAAVNLRVSNLMSKRNGLSYYTAFTFRKKRNLGD